MCQRWREGSWSLSWLCLHSKNSTRSGRSSSPSRIVTLPLLLGGKLLPAEKDIVGSCDSGRLDLQYVNVLMFVVIIYQLDRGQIQGGGRVSGSESHPVESRGLRCQSCSGWRTVCPTGGEEIEAKLKWNPVMLSFSTPAGCLQSPVLRTSSRFLPENWKWYTSILNWGQTK